MASGDATVPQRVNELSGTLAGMSVTFFAGYAAFKIVREYKCDLCFVDMQRPPDADQGDINDTYINFREYQTKKSWQVILLRRPTGKFRNVAAANLQTFANNFKMRSQKEEINENLMEDAIADMLKVCPEWYDETQPCYMHRLVATSALHTA